MSDVLDILSSGLSVARARVNILASNIANAETTRTQQGGPYKRRDLVQITQAIESGFQTSLDQAVLNKPVIHSVVEDQAEPRMVYQPGHPDADQNGYVAYPNINVVTTMTDLMSATRLYQANVTAVETVRQMERDAATLITAA
jgi:flagellar basal-body rod protein FlgC